MNKIKALHQKNQFLAGGSLLVIATAFANFINLLYNTYLGRTLSFDQFASIGLIGSFFYLTSIPFSSLFSTVSFESAFLLGKAGKGAPSTFLVSVKKSALFKVVTVSVVWIALSPFIASFFHLSNAWPIIIFTPVWLVGAFSFANKGYMFGTLMLGALATAYIAEPLIKLLLAILFVDTNNPQYAYVSIPLSFVAAYILSELLVKRRKTVDAKLRSKFPRKFYLGAILSTLSSMAFLSFDILLANHYLSATDAGKYALISMVGKMIYLLGGMIGQFLGPLVSRKEGEHKNSQGVFYKLVALTSLFVFGGFLAVGAFAHVTLPVLFGAKVDTILQYLPMYSFATACFTVSGLFLYYLLAKKVYTPTVVAFFLAVMEVLLITKFHSGIGSLVNVMTVIGILNLIIMIAFYLGTKYVITFERNIKDFIEVFSKIEKQNPAEGLLSILIFNWRDTRHVWAGGAEVYVDQIAKRLVAQGHKVTIFCGNDGNAKRNENMHGIRIIRRGGTYMVYFWALVYYMLKFRGSFDVIVDSENGIPFFTPLFSTKPVILLIHHVHREVFREQLIAPVAYFAQFMEGQFMPFVYKNKTVVTVSESSKNEILKERIAKEKNIQIVNPGISVSLKKYPKTTFPSFIYLGRLKAYKNIDVAIKAFARLEKDYPEARLSIVGDGEYGFALRMLVEKLSLKKKVIFYGKVSENKKNELLSQSWVALQPSLMEGWGITVIEANASGTPVIASNTHGLRDSIIDDKTGILIKVKDINGFSTAMSRLIRNKRKRDLLSKNALLWASKFSWDHSALNFKEILSTEAQRELQAPVYRRFSYFFNRVTSLF